MSRSSPAPWSRPRRRGNGHPASALAMGEKAEGAGYLERAGLQAGTLCK